MAGITLPQQCSTSAGLMPVSLLSWAPNGEYLLEGGLEGSFRVWETHKWTDALWTSQVCCTLSFCAYIAGDAAELCLLMASSKHTT